MNWVNSEANDVAVMHRLYRYAENVPWLSRGNPQDVDNYVE
jgi:hypothetical protein